MSSPRAELWRAVLLVALGFGAGLTAITLRPDPDAVATWWPAAAFCAGAVVLSPRRWWPALGVATALISFAANGLGGRPHDVGVGLGLANAAEALVVGSVLHLLHRRWGRSAEAPRLREPADYFRLLVAALAGAATLAAGSALTFLVLGLPVWEAIRTLTPSHLAAQLVLLPVLLVARPAVPTPRRRAELTGQALLLLAVLLLWLDLPGATGLLVLPMPLLVWVALRHGARVASLEVLAVAVLVTVATTFDLGPLATDGQTVHDHLVAGANVQLYLICLALLSIPTALTSAQRAHLVRRLDAERQLSSTTLSTTAAIIAVTDRDGTVQQVNESLERLTGFTPAEVLGRRFWELELIPPERKDLVREMYAAPDGSGVPRLREADVMHRDGERLRVVWNNNVVHDEEGRVEHVVCTTTDVTSERTSHLLVQHLFEEPLAAPMLSIDADLRISLVNRACEELLGATSDSLVGRSARELMCPDQRERFVADLQATATASERGRAAPPRDWTWHRPDDGRVLTVSATMSAVHDVVGKQVGYLLVARDVTAIRASHDALVSALDKERHAVERLRRLDAAKNDFVSTVSHELRTPTTSIVGYTEMLRDGAGGDLTPAQREMLGAVARNGRRLIDVANDLLTLAGLEAGDRTTWDAVPVDLVAVVTACREAIGPLLVDRQLEVVLDLPGEPLVVDGDPAHLDRVAMNLLSNAVKFTPDRGRVRVRLHEDDGDAVLEVADTGIGIPADEQDGLFTKFFRSSTAQDRAIPGTGLGLSIIHGIVTAHDGTIGVRSALHEGSTFTVRLPLSRTRTPTGGGTTTRRDALPAVSPSAG